MIRILAILLFLFISSNIRSQSISPFTFNVGGLVTKNDDFTLIMSMGEAASISNFTSQNGSNLSSGVLQSFSSLITSIDENYLKFEFNEIKVTPNPTYSITNIISKLSMAGQMQYQVYNISSKLLYRSQLYNVNRNAQIKVDLSANPLGVYYIQIYFKSSDGKIKNGIYKIIKL